MVSDVKGHSGIRYGVDVLPWAYVQLQFHQFLFMLCFWDLIMSTSLLILIMCSWQTWRSGSQSPYIYIYIISLQNYSILELSTSSELFTYLRPPFFLRHLSKTPSFFKVIAFRSSRILQVPFQTPFPSHFLGPLLTIIIYSDYNLQQMQDWPSPFFPKVELALKFLIN